MEKRLREVIAEMEQDIAHKREFGDNSEADELRYWLEKLQDALAADGL